MLSVPVGNDSTVSDYTPGTNEEVVMIYQSDCCTTQVQIRGTDGQGNVGHCDNIDMGLLGGKEGESKEDGKGVSEVGRVEGGKEGEGTITEEEF